MQGVVQLVRTPACHAGGRGFESRRSRQFHHVSSQTARWATWLRPVNTSAIYLRECYATTNFLDPDFWGLSQKVRYRVYQMG